MLHYVRGLSNRINKQAADGRAKQRQAAVIEHLQVNPIPERACAMHEDVQCPTLV